MILIVVIIMGVDFANDSSLLLSLVFGFLALRLPIASLVMRCFVCGAWKSDSETLLACLALFGWHWLLVSDWRAANTPRKAKKKRS